MESPAEYYPTPQSGKNPNNIIRKPEKRELSKPSFLKKMLHQSPDFTKSPKPPQIPKSEYIPQSQEIPTMNGIVGSKDNSDWFNGLEPQMPEELIDVEPTLTAEPQPTRQREFSQSIVDRIHRLSTDKSKPIR